MTKPEGKAEPKKPIDKPQMGHFEQEIIRGSQSIRTNPFTIFEGAEDFPELKALHGLSVYPVDRQRNLCTGSEAIGVKVVLYFSDGKTKGVHHGHALETGFPTDQARAFADHLTGVSYARKRAGEVRESNRTLARSLRVNERQDVGFAQWMVGRVNALDPDVVSQADPPDADTLFVYLRGMDLWDAVLWLALEVDHALEVARRIRAALDQIDTTAGVVDQTLPKHRALAALSTKDPAQQSEAIGGTLRYDPGMARALAYSSPEAPQVGEQAVKALGDGGQGGGGDGGGGSSTATTGRGGGDGGSGGDAAGDASAPAGQ